MAPSKQQARRRDVMSHSGSETEMWEMESRREATGLTAWHFKIFDDFEKH